MRVASGTAEREKRKKEIRRDSRSGHPGVLDLDHGERLDLLLLQPDEGKQMNSQRLGRGSMLAAGCFWSSAGCFWSSCRLFWRLFSKQPGRWRHMRHLPAAG